MIELRRYQRAPLDVPVEFLPRDPALVEPREQRQTGRSKDISVGGMFVITPNPLPFGTELVVYIRLPGHRNEFALPGVVRWSRAGDGMGVQFGLMGARETHAITELSNFRTRFDSLP